MFDACLAVVASGGSVSSASIHNYNSHYDLQWVQLQEELFTDDTNYKRSSHINLEPCKGSCIPFGRARHNPSMDSFACPTTLVSQATLHRQKRPYVQLAVVGLLQDNHHRLLLTRRPSYMRSFPHAWVLPGGAVDDNDETIQQALSREVYEETNLTVNSHGDDDDWKIVGLWESVYPTSIQNPDTDPIYAHHLCIYMSGQVDYATKLRPCAEEVDSAIWLKESDIERILQLNYDTKEGRDLEETVSIELDGNESDDNLNPRTLVRLLDLLGIYPQYKNGDNIRKGNPKGISQGTLFAIEQLYGNKNGRG